MVAALAGVKNALGGDGIPEILCAPGKDLALERAQWLLGLERCGGLSGVRGLGGASATKVVFDERREGGVGDR